MTWVVSIAVYPDGARNHAERYRKEGRVNCVVPADYTENGELDSAVRSYINLIAL